MGAEQSTEQKKRGCVMAPKLSNPRHGRTKNTSMFTTRVYQKDGRGGAGIDIDDLKEALHEENFNLLVDQFKGADAEDKEYFLGELEKIHKDMREPFEKGNHRDFMQAVKEVNDLENIADLFIENGCEALFEEKKQK